MIARALGAAPIEAKHDEEVLTSGEAFDLIQQPNPLMSQGRFTETLALQCVLSGNGYVRPERGDASRRVLWLLPLPPQGVKPIVDRNNPFGLTGWQITGKAGSPQTVGVNDLVHIPYAADPTDPILGVSPLGVARLVVEMDHDATIYNQAILKNSGNQSGFWKWLGEEPLTDDELSVLSQRLTDGYAGPDKAGRPLVVSGNFDFTPTGVSMKDMQWLQARRWNLADIARAFRVPMVFLNEYESSGLSDAGLRVQERMLYTQVVIPLARTIEQALTALFRREVDPDVTLAFNFDGVEALGEEMTTKLEQARLLKELGYPLNGINKAKHLGQEDVAWGDESLVPNMLTTATSVVELSRLPDDDDDPPAAPPGGEPAPAPAPETPEPETATHRGVATIDREAQRAALWRAKDVRSEKPYRQMLGRVRKALLKMRRQALDGVDGSRAFAREDAADGIDPELIAKAVKPAFTTAFVDGFDETFADISVEGDDAVKFQKKRPEVNKIAEKFYDARIDQLVEIGERVKRRVRDTLLEGHANGEALADLKKRVKDVFNASARRAETIARTETQIALNGGAFERYERQMPENGRVEWLSSRDESVRESHSDVDGEVRKLGDEFSNGLMHPCDPGGPPEEVVNCLPAGALVSGEIVGAFRALYSGPMVTVETAKGARLTCTANHPIVTMRGSIPAKDLQVGDQLFTSSRHVDHAVANDDEVCARVEDIFHAIGGNKSVLQSRSVDFHGDAARFEDENVDVVSRNSRLLVEGEVPTTKEAGEFGLVSADSPSGGDVRGSELTLAGGAPHATPLQPLRFRATARLDALLHKAATDRETGNSKSPSEGQFTFPASVTAGDLGGVQVALDSDSRATSEGDDPPNGALSATELLGNLLIREPSLVEVDDVVSILFSETKSAHVFDLQSVTGTIAACDKHSTRLVHAQQCRCYTVPVIDGSND